jgi:hypothetical protein
MQAEINDDIAPGNDGGQIVALVNLPDDLQIAETFRAGSQRLAHAAFRAGNDDFCHKALTRISQINTDSILSVKISAIRDCFFIS